MSRIRQRSTGVGVLMLVVDDAVKRGRKEKGEFEAFPSREILARWVSLPNSG
jgi:hypothetical protein